MTQHAAQIQTQMMKVSEAKARVQHLMQHQQWDEAFVLAMSVLHARPNHDDLWNAVKLAATKISASVQNETLLRQLDSILQRSPTNVGMAALLSLQALCANYPVLAAHIQLLSQQQMAPEGIDLTALQPVFKEPLLHSVLRRFIVPNLGIEHFLTALRARFLAMHAADAKALASYHEVLMSLAMQAHINGYIYYQTPQEAARVATLTQEVSGESTGLMLACYTSPVAFIHALSQSDTPFMRFAQQLVLEAKAWQERAGRIPALGMSDNAISQAVMQQYEEHPYPRWLHLAEIPAETPQQFLHRLFPAFDPSVLTLSNAPEILIAGCGTGRQALEVARRYPQSQVTAIDLSRPSLGYAQGKTEEYGIPNVSYFQADILRLPELPRRFDIVESTGVLHHMQDPMQGWRALVETLKPGGLMKIALYSAKARESITRCRQEIVKRGVGDSEQEMRQFRRLLMQTPNAPRSYPFMLAADFFSMPECRDLLFHRQEHCTSLPEVAEAVSALGLRLIGFDLPNVAMLERYIAAFPKEYYWNNLENWHQLEMQSPLMFFGMYQFWCYKPA